MQWLDRLRRHWARKKLVIDSPRLCHTWTGISPNSQIREHAATLPKIPQYEAFSVAWPQYAGDFVPNYLPYILFLARRYRLGCDLALDLACGSGRMTGQLLRQFGHVHCLDRSPHMLYRLRDGLSRMNGRFTVHEGDFADFTLPEPVPFVVCAGDSVNYVADLDELATVFRCVASCLRPGGFFLFDAIDGPPPKLPPGHGTVTELRGHIDGPFHICLCYDTEARLNDGYCLSPRGVEEHRRILISKEDITSAAAATGLMVEDLFRQDRIFCVLRRPPAP